MRLFVTEFITGGGFANHPLPEGLKQEGLLMLNALLSDCSRISNIQLITSLDSRITLDASHLECYPINNAADYIQQVSMLANECDYVWVIAPESEGVLESLVAKLEKQGATVINCDSESIRLCGDKITCALYLEEAGISTPKSLSLQDVQAYSQRTIMKHRFGVGCEGLKICESGSEALKYIDDFNQWIVQPYFEGEHLSLSMLCYSGEVIILSCNQQIFCGEQEPRLVACHVNAVPVNEQLETLAKNIAKTFPGLMAYVGVDLIQTCDDYIVIDINPRLTSSYAGLSEVLGCNPAELCLQSVINKSLPKTIQRNKKVTKVMLE